uniref:Membrane-bound transcription factor site-2 protease n=2 Tax=Panagrolaimus sp. JU765 TaxID=591449 RepID=A0AC34RDC2_9BILA
MLATTSICLFFLFWTSLFLLDYLLRINNSQRYINFTEQIGLQIHLIQLRFYITRFERSHFLGSYATYIRSWQNSRFWLRFVDTWFSSGAFVGLLSFVLTTAYLSYLLLCELFNIVALVSVSAISNVRISPEGNYKMVDDTTGVEDALSYVPYQHHVQSGITPVIPGVNIPLEHLPLFMTVLVIAGIVHELGHAFAAVNANTRVLGFGIFVYGIYPGAFTEIDTDELERLSTAQKLRIYCAGIWHNLILAGCCYLVYLLIPFLLIPLFKSNAGLLVTDISQESGLVGPSGLRRGFVITSLNDCEVRTKADYLRCLSKYEVNIPKYGYYMPSNDVYPLTASKEKVTVIRGETACCQEFENITSASHICFQFYNSQKSFGQLFSSKSSPTIKLEDTPGYNRANRAIVNPLSATTKQIYASDLNKSDFLFACLPGREVTDHAHCDHSSAQYKDGMICVYPAMYNGTALLRFGIANESNPVIYIGQLSEARYLLNLQELVPRTNWISYTIPGQIELACKYFITFSLALGLLNAVPCYGLDGQFISRTLVDYFFCGYNIGYKENISNVILLYGTIVFFINVGEKQMKIDDVEHQIQLEHLLPDKNDGDDDEVKLIHKGHGTSGHLFKAYVIISMTILWTGYTLMVRYTRSTTPSSEMYSSCAVVFLSEVVKCCICLAFLFKDSNFSLNSYKNILMREFFKKPKELLKMSVPSMTYALQNNLDFIALSNLDAGIYQVTTQLKVVTTAIFMMIFLGRKFSQRRWISIILLFIGVAAVQLNNLDSKVVKKSTENHLKGLIAVLSTCITAGFAGVYFEKMLKDGSSTPFWIRNLQMYVSGIIWAFIGCFMSDANFSMKDFTHGFTSSVYMIIGFLSCGGIYISLVMKHLDNLHKSFASAVSIILVVILSLFLFEGVHIGLYFLFGSSIVCFAIMLYNSVNE